MVPELPRTTIFKRSGPAGRLEVMAKGNKVEVTARAIARYTLLIGRGMFDVDQPIQVVTNGKESFRAGSNPTSSSCSSRRRRTTIARPSISPRSR